MGKVSEYVEKRFGTATYHIESTGSVSTSPTLIAKNNPDRFAISITNHGSVSIGVSLSPRVFGESAFVLGAGGGNLILTADEDGELPTFEYFAVASAGTALVSVVEVCGL